jgi:hypothetical protein
MAEHCLRATGGFAVEHPCRSRWASLGIRVQAMILNARPQAGQVLMSMPSSERIAEILPAPVRVRLASATGTGFLNPRHGPVFFPIAELF